MSVRASYIKKEEVTFTMPRGLILKGNGKPINFVITEEEVDMVMTLAEAVHLYHELKDLLTREEKI